MSATDEVMLDFIPSDYIQATPVATTPRTLPPPSGELSPHPAPPVLTPPPGTASVPMPSLATSTSRGPRSGGGIVQARRLRRRGVFRACTRRIRTPFERARSEFVAVEHHRLQLEADREKNYHEREMERLRLESRRIEMEENKNFVLSRLAGTVDNLVDILPQLRLSSLPSTDIIPKNL